MLDPCVCGVRRLTASPVLAVVVAMFGRLPHLI